MGVRTGTIKGVVDATDVPGGDGSGLAHLAAPARAGGKMTKAQRKQGAQDKAADTAKLEAQAAGDTGGGREPRAKGKAKGKGSEYTKTPSAPTAFALNGGTNGRVRLNRQEAIANGLTFGK